MATFLGSRAMNIAYIRKGNAAHKANLFSLRATIKSLKDKNTAELLALTQLTNRARRTFSKSEFYQATDVIESAIELMNFELTVALGAIDGQLSLMARYPDAALAELGRNLNQSVRARLVSFISSLNKTPWQLVELAKSKILKPHRVTYVPAVDKYWSRLDEVGKLIAKDSSSQLWNMINAARVIQERQAERRREKERRRRQREWEDEQILTKLWPVS